MSENDDKKQQPVWVVLKNCKSCGDCVWACPAGVLSMRKDKSKGRVASVDRPDLCTGCRLCLTKGCPEFFALEVLSKEEFKFPKLTDEARERQARIIANDCKTLPEDGEKK